MQECCFSLIKGSSCCSTGRIFLLYQSEKVLFPYWYKQNQSLQYNKQDWDWLGKKTLGLCKWKNISWLQCNTPVLSSFNAAFYTFPEALSALLEGEDRWHCKGTFSHQTYCDCYTGGRVFPAGKWQGLNFHKTVSLCFVIGSVSDLHSWLSVQILLRSILIFNVFMCAHFFDMRNLHILKHREIE